MTSEQDSSSLLMLAAGMGSRYGGLKQVEPVGPNGETLMDYSLYDARKAGFSQVIFLIREEMHENFHQKIGSKYDGLMKVDYAYQAITDLPAEVNYSGKREKPWGTGHAVWCARDVLKDKPFAVINADDFYGSATFTALMNSINQLDKLSNSNEKIYGSIIGYRLKETLSDYGSVSRGICKINEGELSSVEEWSDISLTDNGINGKDSNGTFLKLSGEEIVSMNVWAFPSSVFAALGDSLVEFLEVSPDRLKDEFFLPGAVDDWIATGRAVFEAGLASCKWMGVTYRDDKPKVVESIREMILNGEYPASLF